MMVQPLAVVALSGLSDINNSSMTLFIDLGRFAAYKRLLTVGV